MMGRGRGRKGAWGRAGHWYSCRGEGGRVVIGKMIASVPVMEPMSRPARECCHPSDYTTCTDCWWNWAATDPCGPPERKEPTGLHLASADSAPAATASGRVQAAVEVAASWAPASGAARSESHSVGRLYRKSWRRSCGSRGHCRCPRRDLADFAGRRVRSGRPRD